jgi:hypothetical protein
MEEIKVDQDASLRFSVLAPNQILIFSINVPEESLTEIVIV